MKNNRTLRSRSGRRGGHASAMAALNKSQFSRVKLAERQRHPGACDNHQRNRLLPIHAANITLNRTDATMIFFIWKKALKVKRLTSPAWQRGSPSRSVPDAPAPPEWLKR
ncbi:MAG: hypothetical protein C5B50_18415 [Verrucomicrobia bacterium]|nr:MAG: hypothetical protein C5B50_18415 [Verrucomicrobiota bacterium]